MPALSVIIPTYNEAAHVVALADSLACILADIDYELIFVDDSSDATPVLLAALAQTNPRLSYLHRSRRGLGSAIVAGFGLCSGANIAVLDADFQHPPALLIPMFAALTEADVVIPSRFLPGGDAGHLSRRYQLLSFLARSLSKAVLRRLRPFSDPIGGLFMFRSSVIAGVRFRPLGWKILAEVLVRGRYASVVELPYRFSPRPQAASKLGWRDSFSYLAHLLRLVFDSPQDRRFLLFSIVGASGFAVDLSLYTLAIHFGAPVVLSGFLSALCAMAWNFTWNDLVTWRTNRHVHVSLRALKYVAVSLVGIAISTSTLALTYQLLHFHPLAAKLVGIILAVTWNYLINSHWTWREPQGVPVLVTRAAA
jgi:dolichol-phosphate mannosyltransferase